MLKNFMNFLEVFVDTILPPRKNFEIVRNLEENDIFSLPKAENVEKMDWIHPLFSYKDKRVKAIVWELKYRNNTRPLETLGKAMFEEIVALMSDIILFDSDAKFLLIPIPITTKRRSERGYNQSEYIAKSILENDIGHFLLYAPQWFTKVKETQRQSWSISKKERVENLSGCFSADPKVAGHYIILIDDVTTTGSTLSEARKTLLPLGTRSVYAFTIAH
jgi:ComF family protein